MAKGHFLLGVLVGGAAAAVATRLLAPESGDEIRQSVNDKLDQLRDRMSDYADFEDDDLAAFDDVDGNVPSDLNTATDDTVDAAKTDETATDDYPDINVDGQSAFAEAKDDVATDETTAETTTDADATAETTADAATDTDEKTATTDTDDKKDDQPEA